MNTPPTIPQYIQIETVQTANLIGQLTAPNAVIVLGMSMVLIALHWKVHITGIALDVTAQVMQRVNVVMVLATLMKIVKAALQTVENAATVQMAT